MLLIVRMTLLGWVLSLVLPVAASAQAEGKLKASLVIVNGRVWTGVPAAPGAVEATALGIRDNKIAWIGDDALVRRFVDSSTKVIDAKGSRVIPGMTDSHIHLISGGFQLGRLSLRAARDKSEFVQAVAAAVKQVAPGRWLSGGRWSVDSWKDSKSPNRHWLDPVTGDTPALLSRMDGHQALANTAALRLAGIDSHGPVDPPGGEIERDPKTREPTGILKESAMELVSKHIPAPSAEERFAALRRAMQHANAHGITSVHDMSNPADIPVIRRAMQEAALTVRVTSYVQTEDWEDCFSTFAKDRPDGDWFRVAGVKGYMDGSLGSRTAYMSEPYADATADSLYPRGQLTAFASDPAVLLSRLASAAAHGFQVAIHAIGDEANHRLLESYALVISKSEGRKLTFRVEHAQHLRVSDIPAFKQLGVVASMQPFHKADDGRYAEKALGKKRLAGAYAFRGLVDAGALVCFGSDWPVVTLNPFAGVGSAVNARTLSGETWLASHSLTVEEAITAYTVSPALAIGRSDRSGTIKVGHFADIVVLDRDPWTIDPERLGDVKVVTTIVGGRVVYQDAP